MRVRVPPSAHFFMSDLAKTESLENSQNTEVLQMWPAKEEYLTGMHHAVEKSKDGLSRRLEDAGFPAEYSADIAVIIIRGQYAYDFIAGITHLKEKVSTSVTWAKEINRNTRASTFPRIQVDGQDVKDNEELKEKMQKGARPSLKQVEIGVNLDEILGQVKYAHRFYGLALEKYGAETAKEMKDEILERTGTITELAVVEEVSHALYIATMFKTQNSIQRWIADMEDYQPHIPGKEDSLILFLSPEEEKLIQEKYLNKRIEVKAAVLRNLFKKKYHPEFSD